MRAVFVALVLLAGCNGCNTPSPQPSPPVGPPPPGVPNDNTVYAELTLAQCLAQTDGGVTAVANMHKSDREPPWLACMYNGGTVASCNVPCAK